ncbi:aromatic ring-hydroxylating dioxygenase subunit alpha [Bdellovibrio sp. BCCA]|uniref:aromatic ring-hydroxylating dioxygenase subunit alpha n=1 Tax=Bdellovibrio sp. BCCA TaxID=3136281 RepID=UPI0030F25309
MMLSLRERDKALINNWYIACLSNELTSKAALKRVIYDTPLALFRDPQGKPTALLDRCVHRGAQLSLGYCDEGHLRCPYHGWRYDSQGVVNEIPSEGKGECKGRHQQRSYPTIEQDGAIWVWMGEGPPKTETPPWRFPNYGESKWCHYYMITDFDNEVTNLVENFMDVPHTVFVHSGWFRDRQMTHVPMTVDVENGQVNVTYHQPQDSIGFTRFLINPLNEKMTHTDRFIFPNITRVDYTFGSSSAFIINSQCTPVSTMKSRVYTYIAFKTLNYAFLLKPLMQFYTRQVIEQDVEIMKNQGDNLKLFPDVPFRSSEADELHLAIEKIRRYGIEDKPETFTFAKKSEKQFWI